MRPAVPPVPAARRAPRPTPTAPLVAFLLLLLLVLPAAAAPPSGTKEVTILYTNDFHSAFDPIPAYWLPGSPRLGGAAHLSTLIARERARAETSFLFDTGDMFTGMLSTLTRGEALMEMMLTFGYDAMAIGNHEFDYGSANFERLMNRVPFPVLGANIFYKAEGAAGAPRRRYARPYTLLERNGVRLGVIGVIGQDARSVALPSGVSGLDFEDPVPIVRELVAELRPQVDLIVVLAHQGKTGPQQTDAENRSEVQRDFEEDAALCAAVPGIDVFVGGHAHRGIESPYVHPKTGTLIVQTYGYGTRLGRLDLTLRDGKVVGHAGELLKVWSDRLPPDPVVAAKLARYRAGLAGRIGRPVGKLGQRLVRDYIGESTLGDFVADAMREAAGAEVAFENAGGLRADLPRGEVTNGDVLDALPFLNSLVTCEMTGEQIRDVVEQGLSLERGLIQISGLRVRYDPSRPPGSRALEITAGGRPLEDGRVYKVATNSFLAEGGDLYSTFLATPQSDSGGAISDVVIEHFRRHSGEAPPPEGGRWVAVAPPPR